MPTQSLRVATYNIHGCVGTDRCFDPTRVRRVIDRLEADLIALQEVETYHHGRDVLAPYQDTDAWHVISGPTLRREQGHYGNALITRLPVHDYRLIDLSVEKREARSAIHAALRHNDTVIEVLATHLGLKPYERRQQVRRLIQAMSESDFHADITLLMGDFNEWFLWGRPLRWLRAHFGVPSAVPRSFPSRFPLFSLDQMWVSPPARLSNVRAERGGMAREASDHLPLIAQLHYGDQP